MTKLLKLTKLAERLLKEIEKETGLIGRIHVDFNSWPNGTNREKALEIGNALAAVMGGEAREWQLDGAAGVNINERGKIEVTVFYRLEEESLTISDQREAAV